MAKKNDPRQNGVRFLLLTDKPVLAAAIKFALAHSAFHPVVATAGDAAVEAINRLQPQLAILDLDVTGIDRVLKGLRREVSGAAHVPIVALTLRTELTARLAAFDQGVDDVLTLPFAPEELLARTSAVMRRVYTSVQPPPLSPALTIGPLKIDITNRTVRYRGRLIHLTSVELSLLYLLAANTGTTLSRDQIIEHLWGIDFVASSNLVDRHIGELRAKLGCTWQQPRFIRTVRGRGYQFLVAR